MRFAILLTGAFLAIFQQILLAQADDWSARHPIPAPSGSFGVGTFSLRITDSSRSTSRHIPTRPRTPRNTLALRRRCTFR